MTIHHFRCLTLTAVTAVALLLSATSLVKAQNITVATVEQRYITLDLHGGVVSPGEAVYVTRSDGQTVQFRIEKVFGNKASALPQTSVQGITVGAIVMRGSTVGKTSVAGTYKQDAPLASPEQTARARQAQAEVDGQATAASHAGRNALIGAIGAMAGGANPGAVNMQAQAYIAQQQTNAANGQAVDTSSAGDLASRFGQGAGSQAASTPGQRSATTGQNAVAANISAQCSNKCGLQTQAARNGSMRASYEAAACTCQCFYDLTPPSNPNRASMRQCAIDNAAQAQKYSSNAPVVTPR